MGKSRFVKPLTTRLFLADVHKRAHAALVATGKASREVLADSEARVAEAVESGDYIDVKRRLSTGEHQDLFIEFPGKSADGDSAKIQFQVNYSLAKVLAYLLTWSLTDDGTPVPMSPDMPFADRFATLRNTDTDTYAEIREAIETHENAMDAEVSRTKKSVAGSPEPAAT